MPLERRLLLATTVLFGALAVLMVLPYEQYLLLAVLLAYLLAPLQRRLRAVFGPRISAGTLIVGVFLAVITPIGVFLAVAARQALSILGALSRGELALGSVERLLGERIGVSIDIERTLSRAGLDAASLIGRTSGGDTTALLDNAAKVFTDIVSVLGTITDVAIGLTVFVFVLYYLLVDGDALLSWLRTVSPFSPSTVDRIYERTDRLLYAVLFGNLLVAIVQGVLVGIGFAALGIPNAILWTIATVVLALLPVIGASVVWLPAVGYLLVVGQPVVAVVLFAYGTLVVSLSDNYLRPVVGGREAQLNPGLFVVGIFGGLAVFGVMGLFFGPVVLGLLKVLVELSAEHRRPVGPAT